MESMTELILGGGASVLSPTYEREGEVAVIHVEALEVVGQPTLEVELHQRRRAGSDWTVHPPLPPLGSVVEIVAMVPDPDEQVRLRFTATGRDDETIRFRYAPPIWQKK